MIYNVCILQIFIRQPLPCLSCAQRTGKGSLQNQRLGFNSLCGSVEREGLKHLQGEKFSSLCDFMQRPKELIQQRFGHFKESFLCATDIICNNERKRHIKQYYNIYSISYIVQVSHPIHCITAKIFYGLRHFYSFHLFNQLNFLIYLLSLLLF